MKEYIEREAAIHAITDTMENYSTFSTERCACIIERQKLKSSRSQCCTSTTRKMDTSALVQRCVRCELFRMWSRSATQGISRGAEIL